MMGVGSTSHSNDEITKEILDKHHFRAEIFILESEILNNIKQSHRRAIALIVKGHRNTSLFSNEYMDPFNELKNLEILTGLLRLADILEILNNRLIYLENIRSIISDRIIKLNGHWENHLSVTWSLSPRGEIILIHAETKDNLGHVLLEKVREEFSKTLNTIKHLRFHGKTVFSLNFMFEVLFKDQFSYELGSGRLRNTLHLLNKGFSVFCTDFEVLYQTGKASANLEKAEKFGNFHGLFFPEEFYELNQTFDLIFLINVPTVMPIPIERLALLSIAREKLHAGGALLWYSDPLIRNNKRKRTRRFLDGYLSEKKVQKTYTFYIELLESEIEIMLSSTGFKINEDISKKLGSFSGNSIAYLAEPLMDFSSNFDLSFVIERGTTDDNGIYSTDKIATIFDIIQ